MPSPNAPLGNGELIGSDAGDRKVRYIEFDPQDEANGVGADWHPNVNTNQIMAEKFLAALKSDLQWQTQ